MTRPNKAKQLSMIANTQAHFNYGWMYEVMSTTLVDLMPNIVAVNKLSLAHVCNELVTLIKSNRCTLIHNLPKDKVQTAI